MQVEIFVEMLEMEIVQQMVRSFTLLHCSIAASKKVALSRLGRNAMWETTFPRNIHAGLGRPFYEQNILTSMKYVRKVPTQSGVAISRKCCFPHGRNAYEKRR